jgi:cation:H+ antiporter
VRSSGRRFILSENVRRFRNFGGPRGTAGPGVQAGSELTFHAERFYIGLFAFTLGAAAVAITVGAPAWLVVLAAFSAVIGAALMISFGAESGQFFVSQGFAVAVIALLQIAPEFVVEARIAYEGDVHLMLANFTGSNRLLMGVGWPLIYIVAAFFHRRMHGQPLREIRLRPEAVIEILALFAPSAYFLIILAKGSFTLLDAAILAVMFAVYMVLLVRLPKESEESKESLIGPTRWIVERPARSAKLFIALLLAVGGLAILLVAEHFVEALKVTAVAMGISTFFFVQWVAPFLSEFPEKVSAFYWAKRVKLAPMALLNMVSSKVNQWTLLVLFIPTLYSIGLGRIADVPLSDFHKQEVLLSIAMTIYGAAALLKRRLTAGNVLALFALWLLQFVFPERLPGTLYDTRFLTALAFLGLAAVEIALRRKEIHVVQDIRDTFASMKGQARDA